MGEQQREGLRASRTTDEPADTAQPRVPVEARRVTFASREAPAPRVAGAFVRVVCGGRKRVQYDIRCRL